MSGAILPPPFSSFFQLFVVGMHFDISFLPSSSSNGFCSASIRFLPPPFSLFNSELLFSFDPSDFCFCDLSLLFASLLSSLYTRDRDRAIFNDQGQANFSSPRFIYLTQDEVSNDTITPFGALALSSRFIFSDNDDAKIKKEGRKEGNN